MNTNNIDSRSVFAQERFGEGGLPPALLIEIPHGATSRQEFEALRGRLNGPFDDELVEFFFVNTDVGAPEVARAVAASVAASTGRAVEILRCLLPRTFVDCNRILTGHEAWTPPVPEYVNDASDRALLEGLHRRYQQVADQRYEEICGVGGLGLILHTYAPRSVDIRQIDASIVRALRQAYAPEVYSRWPRRPEIDLITETDDHRELAPAALIDATERYYAAAGIQTERNGTYRLHPATLGHRHASRYPGQTLCVEISRELLADPFTPFQEMQVPHQRASRMAAPLAQALVDALRTD